MLAPRRFSGTAARQHDGCLVVAAQRQCGNVLGRWGGVGRREEDVIDGPPAGRPKGAIHPSSQHGSARPPSFDFWLEPRLPYLQGRVHTSSLRKCLTEAVRAHKTGPKVASCTVRPSEARFQGEGAAAPVRPPTGTQGEALNGPGMGFHLKPSHALRSRRASPQRGADRALATLRL